MAGTKKIMIDEAEIVQHLPEHAKLAAQMFAIAAHIDMDIGLTLIDLLGGSAPSGLAMYESVRSSRTKTDMVLAAAKVALLDPKRFELLKDILGIVDKAMVPRNELAHWVWCGNRENTKLLLLARPESVARTGIKRVAGEDGVSTLSTNPEFMKSKSLDQLTAEAAALMAASKNLRSFNGILREKDQARAAALQRQLEGQPAIAQARELRNQGRQGKKKSRPPRIAKTPRKSPQE